MDEAYRNYHTHTARCRHAVDADEVYVLTAIACGYDTLGFSDHSPWPYSVSSDCRMSLDELEDYIRSVRGLQSRYRGRIRILTGLECEHYPKYYNWLRSVRDRFRLDYLILGNHYLREDEDNCYFAYARSGDQLKVYADMAVEGMRSGLFAYLAHPDVALASYPQFDGAAEQMSRIICQAAKEMDFPLEYNLQGRLYQDLNRYDGLTYPCGDFWRIAGAFGCKAIVGVDAHAAASLRRTDRIDEGRRILSAYGCRPVDSIRSASEN